MAFIVNFRKPIDALPPLSKAVMGSMSYNLLAAGVYLQGKLEEISESPLLRRTMGTLCSGAGITKSSTNVYSENAAGDPVYDFTLLDQLLDVIAGPRSVPFFGISFMPEDLSAALPPAERRGRARRSAPRREIGSDPPERAVDEDRPVSPQGL